jgi:hypothetical protein
VSVSFAIFVHHSVHMYELRATELTLNKFKTGEFIQQLATHYIFNGTKIADTSQTPTVSERTSNITSFIFIGAKNIILDSSG